MLTLNDGRSELWQWDTGRTLTVDADCSQVHFSNKVFGRSIDVDVVDGVAIIPDVLLQTDKYLNVWAFVGTAENGYTKISKIFKVNRRNKPADYVFTPVEQTTIAEIAAIAQSVRDDADAGLFDGAQGPEGPIGPAGPKGEQGGKGDPGPAGADGKDGTSATHSWNGTVLTITSASGTSSANLKGDKGDKGDTGVQGPKGDTGPAGAPGPTYTAGENITISADNVISATGGGGGGQVQPDWNQNDSTAADYVKNRPFYTGGPVKTVLVEESNVTFTLEEGSSVYTATVQSTFSPTVGETYKVSWDGTVYECVCISYYKEYALGNLSIVGEGSDTGEPFVMALDNKTIQIGTTDTSSSHTISISRYIESVVKINPKYLPMVSETEPGIIAFDNLDNHVLSLVKKEYFDPIDFHIYGYGDANTIEKCANRNNSYGIFIQGKLGGAVLSSYNNPVNKHITSVLSGGTDIKCYKISQGDSNIEQLWGISEDGIIIPSSTANSTKKFRITVDDSGTLKATEVT